MGDLEIRSGRVVAVDTETLRDAAARAELAAADAEDLRATLVQVDRLLGISMIGGAAAHPVTLATTIREQGDMLVTALRDTATAYELVDLRARQAAAAVGSVDDRREAVLLGRRIEALELASPAAADLADRARADAPNPFATVAGELFWSTVAIPFVGPLTMFAYGTAASKIQSMGKGTLPVGSRLTGTPRTPTVTLITVTEGTAPGSMSALARRQPSTERPGDIRVERYTMPGGGQRFALYVSGTRTKGDVGTFGMATNVPLYFGASSSSYESVRIALEKAGAKPGDSVMVSGHSQGAMIASRVALEEEYEVPMLVGFGNPVQADVGPDTVQVDFRHSDDLVPLLAGGGHDASIGAPGSMVVERNVNPWPWIDSHQMGAYTATAEMLDASSDPRMDAVRQRLAEFGQAEKVEVFVYDTEEGVTPSSADAG
ncbi:hypothetical protein ACIQLK_02085 [Microbacterium sp. NPDC091382]|uniref:hypothetical protein n=1 Tax=Microbacterium sp. NPDC091382 TaxID=3364210 RepID=UPI00382E3997